MLPRSEPYFLLGESFGGPLAIALAARQPRGLLGLVLCASFARYPIESLRAAAFLARVAPHMQPHRRHFRGFCWGHGGRLLCVRP
ncbi:MAG: serine aminopeptidase domain-containing protein [Pseudomarimonas sp.]